MSTRTLEAKGVSTKSYMGSMVDGRDSFVRAIRTVNSFGETDGERFVSRCMGGGVEAATGEGATSATGVDSNVTGNAFAATVKCCAAAGQQPISAITAIESFLPIWVDSKRKVKSVCITQHHYFSCAIVVRLLPPGTVFGQQKEDGNCTIFTELIAKNSCYLRDTFPIVASNPL